MEVGEMGRKEPETEIPWVPTTPAKPILPKSVPICTPVEGNDQTHHHGNEAVACSEFSNGSEKNRESCHGSVSMATIADNTSDNGKICEKTGFGNVSCWSDLGGSAKFMFPAEVGSSNSYATQLGNNNGLNDLFVPRVPQETSDNACCSKRTSPDDPTEMLNKDGPSLNKELCGLVVELTGASSPLKENHNLDEGSSLGTGLNKTPEKKPRRKKHRPKVIREGKPKRTPKPATPKPAQSKGNTTGKRKYVRRTELNKAPTPATEVTGELTEKIPEAAEISCRRSLNFEIGTKDESSAGRKSTTGLLDKENGVAVQEPDVGLAFDLYTPGKHPSNSSMSLPEDTQVPDTSSQSIHPEASSQSIHPEAKPKENPTGKKKRVRKKLNKPPTPPTEVTGELTTETMSELARPPCKSSTNFDKGGMEESSTVKENVVIEGTYPDLAYVRRPGLNESSTPTKVSEDLPGKTMPESAENSCRKSLNFDGGERGESSANRENAIVHPSIETGTALQEIEVDLAYDMKALMKQAAENNYQSFSNNEHTLTVHPCKETGAELKDIDVALAYDIEPFVKQAAENNYMSFFNNEQTLSTSPSKTNSPGEKPRGSLTENTYQRRKRMNKSPTSQTEMTGGLTGVLMTESKETAMSRFSDFDMATKYESSAHRQIVNVQMDDVVEETPVGLAYKDSWMKQALHSYIALPEGERKCVRKRSNRTFTPKKMTGELTKPIMSEPAIISCRMSINFDTGGRDESSMCNESLANDQNTLVKEIAHNYTSLSENTQAPSTCLPKSNFLEVKQNARNKNKRKGLAEAEDGNIGNAQASTVKLQMIGCEREHSKTTERADNSQASTVNLQMEMVDWEGEHSGTNERADNSGMNLIGAHYNELHSYQSKPPLQFPNTRLPKCNPPGRKRNARNKNKRKSLAEVEDGNISNGQASTVNSQMVGYEGEHSGTTERADNGQASTVKLLMEMVGCGTEHSGTTEHADNSSVNLIGAHSNGFHSYQSKFPPEFLNIQKKRRTEKGKTSNTHITSSVNTKNGVPPIFAPEDAQVHPYASNNSSWMYGLGYNAAVCRIINESRENHMHSTQTFDEFKLSLRRMAEISLLPNQTCDYNSLMRIRNCIEPNYNAKQLDFSDRQTIREAERPQTCTDVLVEDMHVSCAKKKRSRKRSVLSSSMRPNKDEMQQCHNSALGNHQLTLGKPSGTARRVVRKITYNVEALTEQFRQLNINTGGKELALYGQTALVPFQGSFDPIKKQRPRPKVDLDEETDRVWKLLLLDINHDGVDGTDEEKAKWWEGERNVFRGRAESFIARMHLVQGDRRFSRWKGSVVDSVVGVFLTQNVTDHLSSSAFMSLAARFPKKSGSMCGEGTSLAVNKQQVCVVEPEENTECDVNLLNQSVCNQSSMTVDIVEHSREKTVNSNDSCRITSSPISLTDESNCKQTVSPQRNITECHSPMVVIEDREEKSCHDGTGKELNDIVSSQSSVISSQISGDFSNDQNPEKIGSCSDSNSEVEDLSSTAKYNNCGSFSKLLEMVSSTKFSEVNSQRSKLIENMRDDNATESWKKSNVAQSSVRESIIPSHEYNLKLTLNLGAREVNCSDPFNTEALSSGILKNKDENEMNTPSFQTDESAGCVAVTHSQTNASQVHPQEQSNHMQQSFFDIAGQTLDLIQKERDFNFGDHKDVVRSETNEVTSDPIKKTKNQLKEEKEQFDWDSLRRKAQAEAGKREKTEDTMDSLDWDAVRCADVGDIANTIKERGMNNRLAERIQKFLKRVVDDHGSIDLEWLRDVPPDQAKEYLLSVRGLGLKSVECVRLLTLHHLAFPVDTNVGRIAVRLGWVPLQPLPESLQLHLLEMYPVLESIQKYLWPRLCKLDQKTLYELHYQMITFGKVFCTKSKPNCNACPMRAECRHFASAFASARLALPGPEQKSMVIAAENSVPNENPPVVMSQLQLPLAENTNQVEGIPETEVSGQLARSEINICQPIIEEPATPEPECSEQILSDIEDAFYEDPSEIPTIKLNIEEFTLNLQNYMQQNMELQEGEMSKALVALNPEAASIPVPKLKNISRLRTEHCVYELPDTHPLLEGWDKREPDDPGKYLLAIWTPGETADSTQAPECKCRSHEEYGQLCNEKECFSCNSFREANSQIIRGTLLIPCRTATRGSFPLNGTYFQVNEVFADHESSLNPVSVPRSWIWNLNRRTVYFGTSTTSIFKGLSTQEIQQAFWRGYICVRGFERKLRTPRPLMARLHFPASKLAKAKEKTKKEPSPVKKSQVPKPARKSQEPKPNPEQPELITNGHSLQEKGTA